MVEGGATAVFSFGDRDLYLPLWPRLWRTCDDLGEHSAFGLGALRMRIRRTRFSRRPRRDFFPGHLTHGRASLRYAVLRSCPARCAKTISASGAPGHDRPA